ncbi:MAG: DUF4329 domain-containing protein [Paracoccaceae bacterium]
MLTLTIQAGIPDGDGPMAVIKLGMATIAVGLLAGCLEPQFDYEPTERSQPQTAAEVAFAKSVLNGLQAQSIAENREYCGFIGLNPDGSFAATPAKRGNKGSCRPEDSLNDVELLASYHTHAGHSANYDSEVASYSDLEADILEGVDGYISTPGGRVWFNDSSAQTSTLLCGVGCVTADAEYDASDLIPVQNQYTLEGLEQREQGGS